MAIVTRLIVVLGLLAQGALLAIIAPFSRTDLGSTALFFTVYAVVVLILLYVGWRKTALILVYIGVPLVLFLTSTSLFAPRANWDEEVIIAPGETVIVERSATFRSSGAIGSPVSIFTTRQTLQVKSRIGSSEELKTALRGAVGTGPTGEWVSALTNRFIPKSTLKPLYLHRDDDGQLILVTTFEFCENWVDFKRPIPPYVGFRWTGKGWDSIPVPATFLERQANLLINPGPNTGRRLAVAEIATRNKGAWEFYASLRDVPYAPNCSDPPSDIQRPEGLTDDE